MNSNANLLSFYCAVSIISDRNSFELLILKMGLKTIDLIRAVEKNV